MKIHQGMIGSSSHHNYIHSFPPETQNKVFSHNIFFSLSVFEMPAGILFDAMFNNVVSTIIRQVSEIIAQACDITVRKVQSLMQYAEINGVYTTRLGA